MNATIELPVLTYNVDRAGKDATIARLRAEMSKMFTHGDVLDAAASAHRLGFLMGVRSVRVAGIIR